MLISCRTMDLFVVILTTLVVATAANNATLYTVEEALEDQYIVVLKPIYTDENVEAIKRMILDDVSGVYFGSSIRHTYTNAIKGFSATLTQRALEKLLSREEIEYITQDGVVRTSSVKSWGLDRIDQRYLPLDGTADFTGDGTGIHAYIIDTGIYPESVYFNGRASVAFDAYREEGAEDYGIDCNGHGTHCAGIIGGDEYGVARGAKLFGVRVLNCKGSGPTSDVIAGIDYVTENGKKPAVASMSLGGFSNKAMDNAVEGLIAAGVTVVVAAGNFDMKACSFSPARVNEAITVGATDIDDVRADFSNYGKCVDIFAPGVNIPSAWIDGTTETRTLSGTSMACPFVAGAVAVALGNARGQTPAELKQEIIEDATENVIKSVKERSPNKLLYVP
ncbi:aqualysin-1-like [Lytechinus pictus]|uniref:aqualysin-1-like n=1 Tax=Lytechinus pictus TaxID=7653 RepID=UPI0030BA114F